MSSASAFTEARDAESAQHDGLVIAIHQPNVLPWLGYFSKIASADIFVFLDSVQYEKCGFVNRNRIKTAQGPKWVTIPIKTAGRLYQPICETRMAFEKDWRNIHLRTLQSAYGRTPFASEVLAIIEPMYRSATPEMTLAEFNIALIEAICRYLGINCRLMRSSDFCVSGSSTDLLIAIVRRLGGNVYLSGVGGSKYQDEQRFRAAGISLRYNDFVCPKYPQLWGDFIPNLSVIDALMNCGTETLRLLQGQRYTKVYQTEKNDEDLDR